MKNILIVSIAFPPKCDAEGLQVAKYLKYMVRLGAGAFTVDAVTSELPTLNMPSDATLAPMLNGVRQVVALPLYENRYSNFLIRKILPWAAKLPDPKFSFHLQARRAVRELEKKPDIIYSRSFPLSSAILAYKLKRIYGVPWVMHLSDLWADCPEQNYKGFSRVTQENYERKCFESADVICVTSEKTRAFYERKYPHLQSQIEHYPNVFDLEDAVAAVGLVERSNDKSNQKFRIVHTGSLVGERSAAPLLAALSQLEPSLQNNIELHLVGPVDSDNSRIIKHWNLPFVKIYGQVEYQESLHLQRSADLLVLIDTPIKNPDLRVYFRSKLLDYMIAGQSILAIGDEDSEMQQAFQEHALGLYVIRNDMRRLIDCLNMAIKAGTTKPLRQLQAAPQIYSAEYNASRLLQLMQKLLRK